MQERTNSANVIVGDFTKPSDDQQGIIDTIRDMMATGADFDIFELATQIDLSGDMKRVRDFCINGQLCTKQEWAAALKVSRIKQVLGFVPKTAGELVDKFVRSQRIEVDYQKRMKASRLPVHDGHTITAEDRKDRVVDGIARVLEDREINTVTLARDLRISVAELGMKFTAQEIDDAVSAWFENATEARKTDILLYIVSDDGKALNSKDKRAAWDMVTSQFDMAEHDAAFVEAILKKFIWQVKRKLLGLPVSNHLMPVLLGPQGVGKSTFVTKYLLAPVAELVGHTDFKMIEETRNTEQWRNFVLFLDEMGYAGKADIDNVKNKITASSVTGRPMRSNDNVQYRQNATFIGCSNKELDQLIRDETGNRRFAALRYSSKPDWSKLEALDAMACTLLWKSVDEYGDDPSLSVMDKLRKRQEDAREKSVVEQWLEDHQVPTMLIGKKQDGRELYKSYKDWAETYTPSRVMDASSWGKEFKRLIKAGQVTNWAEPKRSNGTTIYVYG